MRVHGIRAWAVGMEAKIIVVSSSVSIRSAGLIRVCVWSVLPVECEDISQKYLFRAVAMAVADQTVAACIEIQVRECKTA